MIIKSKVTGRTYDIPDPVVDAMESDLKEVDGKYNPLLFPVEALRAYSAQSDYGFKKYGTRDSWKENKEGEYVYSCAASRHLSESVYEKIDQESGMPHLYAVLWNVANAIWHLEKDKK
jgi:hypothetical protein